VCSREEATGERGTAGRGGATEDKGVDGRGETCRGKEGSGRDKSRRVRKERLSSARRAARGTRIVGAGFIEGDIPRNPHATSNRIIAAIAFMFSVVPQKHTLNRLSSQLGALTRWKKNVADTPKAT
jgi:hypothetical protein